MNAPVLRNVLFRIGDKDITALTIAFFILTVVISWGLSRAARGGLQRLMLRRDDSPQMEGLSYAVGRIV
ncbi:MAG: hypothetical protein AAGA56_16920, partial [Myxococcota bacterium]